MTENTPPKDPDHDPEDTSPVVGTSRPPLLGILGPGLITGASDDDPSGIATYSQAGAQYGYGLAWTLLLTYPLMSAVQMIAARVGRPTGHGIAGVLRRHYARRRDIMGAFTIGGALTVLGWLATLLMGATVAAMALL